VSRAYLTEDPTRVTESPRLVAEGTERDVRRAAAKTLGVDTLRGLVQTPTDRGVRYYAPGADDHDGASVEVVS
jgi:hypothetical protein